jgi:hypothetical protein
MQCMYYRPLQPVCMIGALMWKRNERKGFSINPLQKVDR